MGTALASYWTKASTWGEPLKTGKRNPCLLRESYEIGRNKFSGFNDLPTTITVSYYAALNTSLEPPSRGPFPNAPNKATAGEAQQRYHTWTFPHLPLISYASVAESIGLIGSYLQFGGELFGYNPCTS